MYDFLECYLQFSCFYIAEAHDRQRSTKNRLRLHRAFGAHALLGCLIRCTSAPDVASVVPAVAPQHYIGNGTASNRNEGLEATGTRERENCQRGAHCCFPISTRRG